MKLLGAMLILIAGTLIGFQQAARFADRPKQIRMLVHALQRLETEIGYGHTPLPEALERTAHATEEPVAAMLNETALLLAQAEGLTFQQCWEKAIKLRWKETSLRPSEQGVLLRLGSTLGISDKEDQMKHLRLAVMQLQAEEETARDDQRRYEKMWKSLGALLAVLIIILMV
ncbi:stage III sporulation protein SpoIIIAB [Paenibacillus sp. PL2-23]|uniref:stage III sporulation protein SpoIIIAB n=1 Tax=Paenibacillus sp. PL2-23 TaxID=2100729 RepID=UPI0030F799D0